MSDSQYQVAVITSTIGRDTLHETIRSVMAQSIPCKHYVFVHGKQFWDKSRSVIEQYPSVEAVYLPNNNGSDGYAMAPVYALAPYVISEPYLAYLDDDNWFEVEHCSHGIELMSNYQLDWTYSLRRIVDNNGNYLCNDDCESIGVFKNIYETYLVDNSCYMLKTHVARQYSYAWYVPRVSDRNFLAELMKHELPCACTGRSTSNYRLSDDGSHSMNAYSFEQGNAAMHERHPNGLPWHQPTSFFVPQTQALGS